MNSDYQQLVTRLHAAFYESGNVLFQVAADNLNTLSKKLVMTQAALDSLAEDHYALMARVKDDESERDPHAGPDYRSPTEQRIDENSDARFNLIHREV